MHMTHSFCEVGELDKLLREDNTLRGAHKVKIDDNYLYSEHY